MAVKSTLVGDETAGTYTSEWFIRSGEVVNGPYSLDQVRTCVEFSQSAGKLHVRQGHTGNWIQVGDTSFVSSKLQTTLEPESRTKSSRTVSSTANGIRTTSRETADSSASEQNRLTSGLVKYQSVVGRRNDAKIVQSATAIDNESTFDFDNPTPGAFRQQPRFASSSLPLFSNSDVRFISGIAIPLLKSGAMMILLLILGDVLTDRLLPSLLVALVGFFHCLLFHHSLHKHPLLRRWIRLSAASRKGDQR